MKRNDVVLGYFILIHSVQTEQIPGENNITRLDSRKLPVEDVIFRTGADKDSV